MSSKNKTPRKPENKLVNRQDVINFSNFLATNPDFCLRVLHTAQQAVFAENARLEAAAAEESAKIAALEAKVAEVEQQRDGYATHLDNAVDALREAIA